MAAILAFEARRPAAGGAMLAAAISAKLFPGLLLVPLLVQRRWRALAWTAGFAAGFALLGLMVLGPSPYVAFLDYQLPRLADGQAFAFGDAWPEVRELLIADNQGAFGLVLKLRAMGAGFLGESAPRYAARIFGLAILLLTALFARRQSQAPRHLRAAGWLAILGLGAMTSPGAFGDYVPLTATWLLTLVAGVYGRGWRWAVPLSVCWLFQYTVLGTAPIGQWADTQLMIPLSGVGALLMLGLYLAVLGGLFAGETVSTRAATRQLDPGAPLGLPAPSTAGFGTASEEIVGRRGRRHSQRPTRPPIVSRHRRSYTAAG